MQGLWRLQDSVLVVVVGWFNYFSGVCIAFQDPTPASTFKLSDSHSQADGAQR